MNNLQYSQTHCCINEIVAMKKQKIAKYFKYLLVVLGIVVLTIVFTLIINGVNRKGVPIPEIASDDVSLCSGYDQLCEPYQYINLGFEPVDAREVSLESDVIILNSFDYSHSEMIEEYFVAGFDAPYNNCDYSVSVEGAYRRIQNLCYRVTALNEYNGLDIYEFTITSTKEDSVVEALEMKPLASYPIFNKIIEYTIGSNLGLNRSFLEGSILYSAELTDTSVFGFQSMPLLNCHMNIVGGKLDLLGAQVSSFVDIMRDYYHRNPSVVNSTKFSIAGFTQTRATMLEDNVENGNYQTHYFAYFMCGEHEYLLQFSTDYHIEQNNPKYFDSFAYYIEGLAEVISALN